MIFLKWHNVLLFFLINLFSCDNENSSVKPNKRDADEKFSEIEISLLKWPKKDFFDTIQTSSPNYVASIYGIKIWQQTPGEKPTEYAFGLFDGNHLNNIKFKAYNKIKYKIEATTIQNGTGKGLYAPYNNYFYAPFNTTLNNQLHYQKNDKFLPASYQCVMNSYVEVAPSVLVNHAELNRFYGMKDFFFPERDTITHNYLPINIDLYRVSFNLAFKLTGEPIKDRQKLTIILKTGVSPNTKEEGEFYFYEYTNKSPSTTQNKILSFGLEDNKMLNNFYETIYSDTSYTQSYHAKAYLVTYDKHGFPSHSIDFGDTNNIKVKRNHKITYELTVPKNILEQKLIFTLKSMEFIDGD